MIFRNYFLSALDGADLAALGSSLIEVSLGPGQVLHKPGEPAEHVYFPSNAVLSVSTALADGRSVESATIGFEGAAGLISALSQGEVHSRVFVQIAGAAIRITGEKLRERAAASPSLMQLILRHIDAVTVQSEQSVACNALHGAQQRLCRWLLMTQDRVGGQVLPLTQEYLSVMLGVQRTTVTAVATELKAAGLIRYSRGQIEVLDRKGLEHAGCECYVSVRRTLEKLLGRGQDAKA